PLGRDRPLRAAARGDVVRAGRHTDDADSIEREDPVVRGERVVFLAADVTARQPWFVRALDADERQLARDALAGILVDDLERQTAGLGEPRQPADRDRRITAEQVADARTGDLGIVMTGSQTNRER